MNAIDQAISCKLIGILLQNVEVPVQGERINAGVTQ